MIPSDFQNEALPKSGAQESRKSKPRRNISVFITCVVISVMMWLFIELMKDYTDDIKYSVVFENVPKDLILVNNGDSMLVAGVTAQGFELLAARYLTRSKEVKVDLSNLRIQQTPEGYSAYMPSASIIEQLSKQLRYAKSIETIKPDTLFFAFSAIFRKEVPVKLNVSYSVGNQFDVFDTISFSPRTVIVSSIKSVIDTIRFVRTAPIDLQEVDSSLFVSIPLLRGKSAGLLNYSVDSVKVKLDVQRVTEAVYSVPLVLRSQGENIRIFPDKVELQCRVPLAEYPHVKASDFEAVVEYNKTVAGKSKKLKVSVTNFPKWVKVVKVKPDEVEYIIISQ